MAAEPLRVAFYHTELTRDGPGLMLRDIMRGKDAQVAAVVQVIAAAKPDILVMWGIDWDYQQEGLRALQSELSNADLHLEHAYTARPNRGTPTGVDINGDGIPHGPEDAQSFGKFSGENGLAVLSRYPIAATDVQDFSPLLWRDLPDALLPWPGQADDIADVLKLSSTNHWLVPVDVPDQGRAWIGTFSAMTPVFDGPEDRNGRRNHDEIMFWVHLLNGRLDHIAPEGLIIAGHTNLDPKRGDGRREAIRALLDHPTLQDPAPNGAAGDLTVDWKRSDLENMRLSYVLPSRQWTVVGSGVWWPDPGTEAETMADTASRHRLVWVDLERAP